MKQEVASFPRQLAWYSGLMCAAALGFVAYWSWQDRGFVLLPLLLFSGLAIFAVRLGIVAPYKGVSFLPTTMVFMAALVVLDDAGFRSGAVLVGLAAGLGLPAFSRKTWGWIVFNGSMWGLSVAVAVFAYSGLREVAAMSLPTVLVSMVVPALAFFVALGALLVASYLVERGRAPVDVVAELISQDAGELPFAVLGFFIGRLYLSLGPAVVLLIIVPIVIAREVFASFMRVKESHEETVNMLILALERKDPYTAGHAGRVANYAKYMGEELNFMPARLERLRFAAMMHDIGKLVVPNRILNKPGRLTAAEFEQVRMHEKVGVQMLSHIDFLQPIARTAHADAMQFDPDDPDHPIEPYIVMIADAYDAMTSTRSYRKALSQEVAFQELRDKAGIQFHPQCVEALIYAVEKRGEKHGAGYEHGSEFDNAPDAGLGSAGLGDLADSEDTQPVEATG